MSSSPLPQNYGYRAIKPPAWLAIVVPIVCINMNPNGPSCDLPGDPNILPVPATPGCD
jgi:hypothetical protein